MALFANRHAKPDRQPAPPQPVPAPAPTEPPERVEEPVAPEFSYALSPAFKKVREEVQQYLVNEVRSPGELGGAAKLRPLIEPVFNQALEDANLVVSRAERTHLLDTLMADIFGYGPIQPLLDRDDISEVMVNGPNQVYVEEKGKLRLTPIKFADNNQVLRVIERIVAPLGRRIDEASPMVDARLPDGSRVNAIIPPLALDGPSLTIRKFRKDPLKIDDLIRFGSLTPEFAQFVRACVVAKLNIIVSGGTGSGKTTMLNVLSSCIPPDDRIVTIEDAAELQLQQPHVVRLEKRPPNVEGKGEVTIRDLMVNSLRMRPDRIVVGEVRGGEALDMLQAMNTGHDGSLTTAHANTARDALNRIETMVLMSGVDLPLRAIRQQMAAAVDMIIQVQRMRDGSRRVIQCAEVLGMEGETLVMQDIFVFEQTGIGEDGKIVGELKPTGLRPRASERIAAAGISLPPNIFGLNLRKV
ncbi:MAG: type II secretion system protein E [Chloroflexi bacterium]|nr:MAG: type II secretion system protein E [Chloroflexota bacterium]